MRKINTYSTISISIVFLCILLGGLKFNGVPFSRITVPIAGMVIIANFLLNFTWIFKGINLLYKIWRITGKVSLKAFEEYKTNPSSVLEIEKKFTQ